MNRVGITQSVSHFDPGCLYDLNVTLPIRRARNHARRFEGFRRCGLYKLGGYKVHLTLVGTPDDLDDCDTILMGWPPKCRVTLLIASSRLASPKSNASYRWQKASGLCARWHLRLDDDSMTYVGRTSEYVDHRHGENAVHLMTSPFFHDGSARPLLAYLASRGVMLLTPTHEHESSLSSDAAIERVSERPLSTEFFECASWLETQPGDQPLAPAMQIAQVPMNSVFGAHFKRNEVFATADLKVDQRCHNGNANDISRKRIYNGWTN